MYCIICMWLFSVVFRKSVAKISTSIYGYFLSFYLPFHLRLLLMSHLSSSSSSFIVINVILLMVTVGVFVFCMFFCSVLLQLFFFPSSTSLFLPSPLAMLLLHTVSNAFIYSAQGFTTLWNIFCLIFAFYFDDACSWILYESVKVITLNRKWVNVHVNVLNFVSKWWKLIIWLLQPVCAYHLYRNKFLPISHCAYYSLL